jgi:hypothetical protein
MSDRQQETDFMEGMKNIYDALHPDLEEESIPTHLIPYRGGAFGMRRSNGNISIRGLDGRQ